MPGALGSQVTAIVGGVIALVIGMVLMTTVMDQAATTGASGNIGSFSGTRSINDLIPLVYISAILLLGVSLFAIGTAGIVGRGPLRGR
ncbi:hypothetical protein LCGC14_1727490 [marine sediment metagenome]|uniref:Uncharacterized protein n=1 Tax=marine sediment metagenome TaxID=412755 RepID=A0A0F9KA97_9ZZZZ